MEYLERRRTASDTSFEPRREVPTCVLTSEDVQKECMMNGQVDSQSGQTPVNESEYIKTAKKSLGP